MDWDAASTIGLVRSVNEDSWAFEDMGRGVYLGVVADGIGGYDGGEVASALAVRSVVSFVSRGVGNTPLNVLLERAVEDSNAKVFEEARVRKGLSMMGTTLTAAAISEPDSIMYVAHIGDSRAYIVRDGHIRQITDDHSVTGELVRTGTISEEEAMRHPARNVLTMALGTGEVVRCSTYSERIFPGDTVLLCTDGLSSVVSGNELLAVLGSDPAKGVAKHLAQLADSRGGHDNTTVLVLWPFRFSSLEARCQA